MRRTVVTLIAVGILICGKTAFAHRIDEYLQATILSLGANRVQGSMRLIPGVLVSPSVISAVDSNGDGAFSDSEERAYAQRVLNALKITLDGSRVLPRLVSWTFPQPLHMRDGLGEIHIGYEADLPPGGEDRRLTLVNHHMNGASVYLMNVLIPEDPAIRIVAQERNERQSLYELSYRQLSKAAAAPATVWHQTGVRVNGFQFASLFHLGMRHIAEGTDHLLFLLALLLPAPLLIAGQRWGGARGARGSLLRILEIVTAFTIGHSVTLSLAAFGFFNLPSRPVEVLIAVSIFISAVHALHPIFPGKEAVIAASFGLIHGLAFAATLDRLGWGRWERVAGVLAFNLGIETMQMIVVAAVLPSLLLLSRTHAYRYLRIGGALFAGTASAGWLVERLFDLNSKVDAVVGLFARHSPLLALNLALASVVYKLVVVFRARQRPTTAKPTQAVWT